MPTFNFWKKVSSRIGKSNKADSKKKVEETAVQKAESILSKIKR